MMQCSPHIPEPRIARAGRRAAWCNAAVISSLLALTFGCGNSTSDESQSPMLYINEFMAQNDSTIADTDGTGGYPDWIEIYNAGSESVDLSGMYLTDDLKQATKWRIPDGVMAPARGYLLFWADNDPEQGGMHTNFKLDTVGEEIGLFNTAANNYAPIDTVTFGLQVGDVSFGRSPDGVANWKTFSVPTPGQAND